MNHPASIEASAATGRRRTGGADEQCGRVVILAHSFPPENLIGARRPYHFAKYLLQFGYDAEVIAAPYAETLPGWSNLRRVPEAAGASKSAVRTARALAAVQRYVLPYHCELEWAAHAFAAAGEILAGDPNAVLISTSPPVATHIAALELKRRYGVRWIADCRDPIQGNPFHTSLRGRLFDSILERTVISRADAIIANTDTARMALQQRYPRASSKIHLIWNGYDPEHRIAAEPIGPRGYKVMAHIGSLYGGRHPGMLMDSMARLLGRGILHAGDLRVQLVGYIELDQPWVRESRFSSLHAMGCVEYTDHYLPQKQAEAEMARADYLLLIDLNESGKSLQVPGKLFEYIRVGRPILALTTKDSPVERILAKSGVAHACLHPGDPDVETDQKLQQLLDMPTTAAEPSQWFREHFDASAQTGTLASLLDAVSGRQCALTAARK